MADNTELNTGSGGDTIRTEDRTTFKTPVSLLDVGGVASESIVGDAGVYVPVDVVEMGSAAVAMNEGVLGAGVQRVSLATDDDLVAHGATIAGDTTSIDGKITACNTGAVVIASGTITAVTAISDALPAGTNAIGKLAANSGVDIGDVDILSISAGDNNIGNVDIVTVPAPLSTTGGGTEAAALRVTIANDSTGTLTVDNAGTFAVQSTLQTGSNTIGAVNIAGGQTLSAVTTVGTVTTCQTVTTLTGSGVAHDGLDSGNPHKIGAKATTSISALTPVATTDRTDLFAGADGVLITRNHCNLEDIISEVDTNTDGASTAFGTGMAAPGAGIKIYVTKVTYANSSATDLTVDLRDGAAGSVLWTTPVPAGGGALEVFDPPLGLTANTALAYDGSGAATTLTISALGFKSKV